MSPNNDPFPAETWPAPELAALVADLSARPGMFVQPVSVGTVAAYIYGFNAARGSGPLLGFREWLIVRVNGGNNLPWVSLVMQLAPPGPESEAVEDRERRRISFMAETITEYLRYRQDNGVTKVYYDYGKWLLRKRWYRGPLRKRTKGDEANGRR